MGSDPWIWVFPPLLTGSLTVGKVLILSDFRFLLCKIKIKNIHTEFVGRTKGNSHVKCFK